MRKRHEYPNRNHQRMINPLDRHHPAGPHGQQQDQPRGAVGSQSTIQGRHNNQKVHANRQACQRVNRQERVPRCRPRQNHGQKGASDNQNPEYQLGGAGAPVPGPRLVRSDLAIVSRPGGRPRLEPPQDEVEAPRADPRHHGNPRSPNLSNPGLAPEPFEPPGQPVVGVTGILGSNVGRKTINSHYRVPPGGDARQAPVRPRRQKGREHDDHGLRADPSGEESPIEAAGRRPRPHHHIEESPQVVVAGTRGNPIHPVGPHCDEGHPTPGSGVVLGDRGRSPKGDVQARGPSVYPITVTHVVERINEEDNVTVLVGLR